MNQKISGISLMAARISPRSNRRTGAKPSEWYRDRLMEVLARAQHGYLILREHGRVAARFGDASAVVKAEIDVHDLRVYRRALLGGDCGAAEAYVDGWWDSPDLTQVTRFFSRNLDMMDQWSARFAWVLKPLAWWRLRQRRNSLDGAKQNILAHYDLGNELYRLFLDSRMQYSSGLYLTPQDSLETAQEQKLRRLADKLELKESDHLLEIGTGWGGLALYAASEYGCRVTTTTISQAQYEHTCTLVRQRNLQDRINVLCHDYRLLQGHYDKIVSVEMIEAVGRQYLTQYFSSLNKLLKPGGSLMLQAITIVDQRESSYARNEDFIQKHIFPGGYLPSISGISLLLSQQTELVMRDLYDMGLDYAHTLRAWRQRFEGSETALEELGYDERFRRLWRYYLAYCEGGFLERRISTVQLLATKAPHTLG